MPTGVELGRAGVKSILRSTLVSTLELPPKSHQPDPRSQPPTHTNPSPSTAADSAHAEQRDYEHELELALTAMARTGGCSGAGAPGVVSGEAGVGEGEGRCEAGGGGEGVGEGEGAAAAGGGVGACVSVQILRAQHVTKPCEPEAYSRDPTNAATDDASAVTRHRLAWLRAGLEGSRARLSFARLACFAPVLCNMRILSDLCCFAESARLPLRSDPVRQ